MGVLLCLGCIQRQGFSEFFLRRAIKPCFPWTAGRVFLCLFSVGVSASTLWPRSHCPISSVITNTDMRRTWKQQRCLKARCLHLCFLMRANGLSNFVSSHQCPKLRTPWNCPIFGSRIMARKAGASAKPAQLQCALLT